MGHDIGFVSKTPGDYQKGENDSCLYQSLYMTFNWSDMIFHGKHFHGRCIRDLIPILRRTIQYHQDQGYCFVADTGDPEFFYGVKLDHRTRIGVYMSLLKAYIALMEKVVSFKGCYNYAYTDQPWGLEQTYQYSEIEQLMIREGFEFVSRKSVVVPTEYFDADPYSAVTALFHNKTPTVEEVRKRFESCKYSSNWTGVTISKHGSEMVELFLEYGHDPLYTEINGYNMLTWHISIHSGMKWSEYFTIILLMIGKCPALLTLTSMKTSAIGTALKISDPERRVKVVKTLVASGAVVLPEHIDQMMESTLIR